MAYLARAAFFLTLLLSVPALAQDPRDAEIQSAISRQVDAFRRDDANGAYAIASPTIQEMFGTAGNFLEMVQRGYPQVYRPRSLTFGKLQEVDGKLLQRVIIQGPDGAIVTAVYEMVQIDGRWRINGCYLLAAKDEA